jgi:hypothetical protein
MKPLTIICLSGAIMTALLSGSVPAEAAAPVARARFSFDGLATCERPAGQSFPIHAGVAYCSKLRMTHAECAAY